MKLLAFWLLLTLAVLVPATASLAATVLAPVSVAKASCSGVISKACGTALAAPVAAHTHEAAEVARKLDVAGHGDCCDAGCDQCIACTGCGVVTVLANASAHGGSEAAPQRRRLETSSPRAEFLLTGQDRPPRHG
jgi:hypothetical protein